MIEKLIAVRKHGGEKYKIFVILPEYDGEAGVFGIEEDPHIRIETPENCFGYSDTILFDNRYGKAYTLHRYLQPYILKALERQTEKIRNRLDYSTHEFYTREEWQKYIGGNIDEWECRYKSLYPNEKIKYALA